MRFFMFTRIKNINLELLQILFDRLYIKEKKNGKHKRNCKDKE